MITHYKTRNTLLSLLNKCISARSAPQLLPLKDEDTFCFSNFLIIDLGNFSASCRLANSK